MSIDAAQAKALDAEADEAAKEIPNLKDPHDIAKWFRKWRHATYKRLVNRLCNYYGES